MPICAKCNTSIKPASLATQSGENNYHPTCISCSKCDRPLWGRGFRREKQKLICDPDCNTSKVGPQSVRRPPSGSKQAPAPAQTKAGFRPVYDEPAPNHPPPPQPVNPPPVTTYPAQNPNLPPGQDFNMHRRQVTDVRMCKACGQSLENRRFLTYENGDTICQECDFKSKNPIVILTKIKHQSHYVFFISTLLKAESTVSSHDRMHMLRVDSSRHQILYRTKRRHCVREMRP